MFNHFREMGNWLHWLQSSLVIGFEDNGLKASVRKAIGDVQQFRDDRDAALASYNEALKLFKNIGDKLGEANTPAALSRMSLRSGKLEETEKQFLQIIQMRRLIGDLYSAGADTGNFAIALLQTGHKDKAKEYALKAKAIFEKIKLHAIVEMMDQVIAASNE